MTDSPELRLTPGEESPPLACKCAEHFGTNDEGEIARGWAQELKSPEFQEQYDKGGFGATSLGHLHPQLHDLLSNTDPSHPLRGLIDQHNDLQRQSAEHARHVHNVASSREQIPLEYHAALSGLMNDDEVAGLDSAKLERYRPIKEQHDREDAGFRKKSDELQGQIQSSRSELQSHIPEGDPISHFASHVARSGLDPAKLLEEDSSTFRQRDLSPKNPYSTEPVSEAALLDETSAPVEFISGKQNLDDLSGEVTTKPHPKLRMLFDNVVRRIPTGWNSRNKRYEPDKISPDPLRATPEDLSKRNQRDPRQQMGAHIRTFLRGWNQAVTDHLENSEHRRSLGWEEPGEHSEKCKSNGYASSLPRSDQKYKEDDRCEGCSDRRHLTAPIYSPGDTFTQVVGKALQRIQDIPSVSSGRKSREIFGLEDPETISLVMHLPATRNKPARKIISPHYSGPHTNYGTVPEPGYRSRVQQLGEEGSSTEQFVRDRVVNRDLRTPSPRGKPAPPARQTYLENRGEPKIPGPVPSATEQEIAKEQEAITKRPADGTSSVSAEGFDLYGK